MLIALRITKKDDIIQGIYERIKVIYVECKFWTLQKRIKIKVNNNFYFKNNTLNGMKWINLIKISEK